jgi:hypothetical protein
MLHLHSRTAELVDRGHTDQPVAPVSRDRLLEHLVSEVQACAVGIAMIATAANAMNDWQASIAPPDMARFAPDSAALRSLLKVLDAHHIDTEPPDAAFRAFADEVDTARIALDSFLNDCEALSPDRAKLLHARRLQDVWRHLARKSRSFILESERLFPKSIPYLYTQNTSVLSALLAGTASG